MNFFTHSLALVFCSRRRKEADVTRRVVAAGTTSSPDAFAGNINRGRPRPERPVFKCYEAAASAWAIVLSLWLCAGCQPPGKPTTADIELKPQEVKDFAVLYQQHCAGCHGQDGKGNTALALANPVYLAIASDETIRRITTSGIRGSLMPAFAKSSGGMLTDEQIEIVVHEMRTRWAKSGEGVDAPPYAANGPSDASRGTQAFAVFCAGCHGPEGKGTGKGSSIVDDSFLALVSDQNLRTTVIAGRPDLGHPDWRNDVPGRPMTAQEVTDVVAWLVAQRKANPGQPYPKTELTQIPN
jgi:cytochrome c oxidase cbb3-type subunit 3/ubiquinol-cytochrome c reductase cytochrome c subunit